MSTNASLWKQATEIKYLGLPNTNYKCFIYNNFHYIIKPLDKSEQHIIWCKHLENNMPMIVLKDFPFDNTIKYNSKYTWSKIEVQFSELKDSLGSNIDDIHVETLFMGSITRWMFNMLENDGIQQFERKIRHSGRHKPGKLFNEIKCSNLIKQSKE